MFTFHSKKAPGVFFKLDDTKKKRGARPNDFKGYCSQFQIETKKLKSYIHNPVEMPEGEFWHYVGPEDEAALMDLYKIFIKEPIDELMKDRQAGIKQLPRAGGKFARKRLRF